MFEKLTQIVKLKYLDELQNGDILVEDCGGLVTELSDYGFVIEERSKPALQDIYNSLDSKNAEHVSLILNNPKGPLVVYSAITAEYGTTITEWVLDKVENDLDNFLSYFGIAQNYQPNNYVEEQETNIYQNDRQVRQPVDYNYGNEQQYRDTVNYREPQRVQQYPEEVYRGQQQVDYSRNAGRSYQPEAPQRNFVNQPEVSTRDYNNQQTTQQRNYNNEPQYNAPSNQGNAEYFMQNEFNDFCNLALQSNANNIGNIVNTIKYNYNNGNMIAASADLADLLDDLERSGLI